MFNEQITRERANHAFYRACSAYLEAENLQGMATFMKKQAAEEMTHADKLIDYLGERGDIAQMQMVDAVVVSLQSVPRDLFIQALASEITNTNNLKGLHQVALATDQQAAIFLQWFLTEQVEEEALLDEVVARFARLNDSGGLGVELMDRWLGEKARA
jgi:ferritin